MTYQFGALGAWNCGMIVPFATGLSNLITFMSFDCFEGETDVA